MAAPVKINFKVYQGSTFRETLRWESAAKGYYNITNITKTAPAVITVSGTHQIPVGWRAKVVGVSGMKEINSDEYRTVTQVTSNTITFNEINAANYTQYTSGGIVEYNTPVPISQYTARMQLRPSIASDTVITTLTTENGGILLDTNTSTITLVISAATTAAFTWQTCLYGLELITGNEVVSFATGTLTLVKEVTR